MAKETSKSVLKRLKEQNKVLNDELKALALVAEASTDNRVQQYANIVLRGLNNDTFVDTLITKDTLAEPVQMELELDAGRYDFLRRLGLYNDEVVDAAMCVYEGLEDE